MTVAELLAESRAAHMAYRQNTSRKQSHGGALTTIDGDPVAAKAAIERAGLTRKAAHDADPLHTDPAWSIDLVSHDTLLTFYAETLAGM